MSWRKQNLLHLRRIQILKGDSTDEVPGQGGCYPRQ